MIDQVYQSEINSNLDDQQARPGLQPRPTVPLMQGFFRGAGGLIAGPLQGGAAFADLAQGDAQVLASTGTMSAGGMFSLPSQDETQQNNAAYAKLMKSGPNFNSAEGAAMRTRAKDFLPDPQTTGKAGVMLGGLTTFAGQAIPLMAAGGPAGLVALGTARGVQKADELQEQGVDEATRTAAGIVSGAFDAGSMVLPMTGASRAIAAAKGAVGGAAVSIGQTGAEKLLLQANGYDKIASTYDPFDPVSIGMSSLVPAAFGALHSPSSPVKAPGEAKAEPNASDFALSPAEQANSDAMEASSIDVDIASIQKELTTQKDAGARQVLQDELDRLQRRKAAGPVQVGSPEDSAARVRMTADAVDSSRLTPDDDLAGRDQHQQAVETASDQIARGDDVDVADIVKIPEFDDGASFLSTSPLDDRGFPIDYIDTRGSGERFHGTSRPIDALSDDYAMNGDNRNIYGQGFYTTDAADIAGGYMRKGRGREPSLYRVQTHDVKLFDMDSPMSTHTIEMLRNSMGDAFPDESHENGHIINTMREAFDEFRAGSRDNGLTRDDVQEVFDSIRYNLEQEGYRGYQHIGGDKTGSAPHSVHIFWNPESDVTISPARIADFARAVEDLRSPAETNTSAHIGDTDSISKDIESSIQSNRNSDESRAIIDAAHPVADKLGESAAEVLRNNPDLMLDVADVQDAQGNATKSTVRAADYLESVRQQAAGEHADATLLEVAARCFIS